MRIGTAQETYAADEAVFTNGTQKVWFGVLLAALAVFPFVSGGYFLFLACLIGINVISATGLNILTGFTGQMSLGQAALMGVGGYTVALLTLHTPLPLALNLFLGGLSAAVAGILVGGPSLRIKGLYLAIATVAANYFFQYVVVHWTSVTNGPRGLIIEPPKVLGLALDSNFKLYWLIVPLAVLLVAMANNLFRTRVGRAFVAIRDRDFSAEVLGIQLFHYKLYSFAVSSFYAGIAGGLLLCLHKVVTPATFPLEMSIFFLAAIIVGGMGTILGGILGAVFMTMVPEVLKLFVDVLRGDFPSAVMMLAPAREVVFGGLIAGFLLFESDGLAEIWGRMRRFFRHWPFRT